MRSLNNPVIVMVRVRVKSERGKNKGEGLFFDSITNTCHFHFEEKT